MALTNSLSYPCKHAALLCLVQKRWKTRDVFSTPFDFIACACKQSVAPFWIICVVGLSYSGDLFPSSMSFDPLWNCLQTTMLGSKHHIDRYIHFYDTWKPSATLVQNRWYILDPSGNEWTDYNNCLEYLLFFHTFLFRFSWLLTLKDLLFVKCNFDLIHFGCEVATTRSLCWLLFRIPKPLGFLLWISFVFSWIVVVRFFCTIGLRF